MSTASSAPYVRHITNPTDAELSKLVDIFVEAFKDDPWGVPDRHAAQVLSARPDGECVHGPTADERRPEVSAALGGYEGGVVSEDDLAEGTSALASTEARAAGWDQFIARLPAALRAWWQDCFSPAMKKLSLAALGVGGAHRAWHLLLFGVLPAHQGRGYGRVLVEHVGRLASETHTPLVVETGTETSVKIYTKLGFDVVRHIDLPSDYGDAHVWLLTKKPLQVASTYSNARA
ncbi:hypothetical protein HYPSUDRAFT_220281 [Hypholoma sublateritium FD-334 SS-4]|uniref:N-acetyltransferase domain-containing protein n=1 Tax=Hypholoma sublateritium (strain FD-334 SS-4) TaxID=945553 RepID=A0A0D2P2Q8_HYPSF|nr:hypothetical protein HYPSUDRAFT_220281 [Hypholoma sublateritium FD-334 SS-4]